MQKTYIAIDLKSFYASVECVERGLNPLTAKLVVADESRTEKTICLAVSPALKQLGIPGRARLFEVYEKARNVDFIIAKPRMNKYLEVSKKIFGIYAEFIATEDIHVYSVDEVFMDATNYLKMYNMSAEELARKMIQKVLEKTGITATAGIGENLYLAKVAMDIVAKHLPADENGVRIASLTEKSYREKLWEHEPITDFWRVGRGYAKRLGELGIKTMGDLAYYSLTGAEKLYKVFGVNAELLIDHAWGWEPVSIADIKNYRTRNRSLNSGQVLSRPYKHTEAKLVTREMAEQLALDLMEKNLVTDMIVLTICYDISSMSNYDGEISEDFYGRKVPKNAHGTIRLSDFSCLASEITAKTMELYEKIVNKNLFVRKIFVVAGNVKNKFDEQKPKQLDIFTNYKEEKLKNEKEEKLIKATLEIKKKFGKNAILKAMNLEEGATMRDRNMQVGGHKA